MYQLFFIDFFAQPSTAFFRDVKYHVVYYADLQYHSRRSLPSISGWTQSRHRIANKHHAKVKSTSWIVVHPYSLGRGRCFRLGSRLRRNLMFSIRLIELSFFSLFFWILSCGSSASVERWSPALIPSSQVRRPTCPLYLGYKSSPSISLRDNVPPWWLVESRCIELQHPPSSSRCATRSIGCTVLMRAKENSMSMRSRSGETAMVPRSFRPETFR